MEFIQIIEVRTNNVDGLRSLDDQWEQATEGERHAAAGSIIARDRNDPDDRYLILAFFDSYESAMANSSLPETAEFGRAGGCSSSPRRRCPTTSTSSKTSRSRVHRSTSPSATLGSARRRTSTGFARADKGLEVVDDVPHVDVHGRGHDAVSVPEGDELVVLEVAAHHDVVARTGMADVLEAEVELVGEEIGQPGVGIAAAGRVASGRDALVERVRPMLDPQVPAVVGMGGAGGRCRPPRTHRGRRRHRG